MNTDHVFECRLMMMLNSKLAIEKYPKEVHPKLDYNEANGVQYA